MNVLALARMLGHKDPSVTLRLYADLFDADLDAVAATLHARYGLRRNQPAEGADIPVLRPSEMRPSIVCCGHGSVFNCAQNVLTRCRR